MRQRNHWDTDKPEGCLMIALALVVFWIFIGAIVYFARGNA